MDQDSFADMFQCKIGDCVRWTEYPTDRSSIGQRRWTQREMLAPVVEYRLRSSETRGSMMGWVAETDLMAWQDDYVSLALLTYPCYTPPALIATRRGVQPYACGSFANR